MYNITYMTKKCTTIQKYCKQRDEREREKKLTRAEMKIPKLFVIFHE